MHPLCHALTACRHRIQIGRSRLRRVQASPLDDVRRPSIKIGHSRPQLLFRSTTYLSRFRKEVICVPFCLLRCKLAVASYAIKFQMRKRRLLFLRFLRVYGFTSSVNGMLGCKETHLPKRGRAGKTKQRLMAGYREYASLVRRCQRTSLKQLSSRFMYEYVRM